MRTRLSQIAPRACCRAHGGWIDVDHLAECQERVSAFPISKRAPPPARAQLRAA
jgi:hypothetical protein